MDPAARDSQRLFVDFKKYDLVPDTLSFQMTISDEANGRKGELATAFLVREFGRQLSMSDILFISALQKPGDQIDQKFVRGGLVMVPHPSRIYLKKGEKTAAWFYFETNHLQVDAHQTNRYSIHYRVSSLKGEEIWSQEKLALPVTSFSNSRVEKIPLQAFKTGTYCLKLNLTEQSTGSSVSQQRYFQVIADEAAQGPVLPMTAKDEQRYFDQIKYIATKEEKDLFKRLDANGKGEFIIRFWQSKDPTPGTLENEFMVEHFRRLSHAEKSFKGGLNADRARIYIQYGAPLDVQRMFSNTKYNKPVEIWTYPLHGGIEFVFVDRTSDGNYVLVHSNHPDEYANPDWERDVK